MSKMELTLSTRQTPVQTMYMYIQMRLILTLEISDLLFRHVSSIGRHYGYTILLMTDKIDGLHRKLLWNVQKNVHFS